MLPKRIPSLLRPRLSASPSSQRAFSSSSRLTMRVIPVPVRDDNYAYVVVDTPSGDGVFVDPYTLSKVQDAANGNVENVVGCITTHHHHDHSGGNDDFAKAYAKAPIWAGSQTPTMNTLVKDGSDFKIGQSIAVKCHATPCHTQDSIAFFLEDTRSNLPANEIKRAVFTGDTLFVSGCGRFFEGTPAEMHTALNKVLASLPDDTVVFCGHEYTKSNVAFSAGVLPERPAILQLLDEVRKTSVTTGKYTIGDEKKHNVFMLVGDAEVQQRVGTQGKGEIETMSVLRELKNSGKMMAKV
ncbi:Metallo-hydrolase/oxidoreductase [Jaminaea rosea]|uniref:hydroxyacylglutathione hydrolase n=1 Tax=Jaminaea rosea TaxID=1569628 RepID=A0A316UN68_9BASI|nr:Metallo-hydrolase/oxidoreductase [Jaminaea rosea]PWN26248.1 Metallo-hydrolase/oxidoreductase [Jaminaea rosea]